MSDRYIILIGSAAALIAITAVLLLRSVGSVLAVLIFVMAGLLIVFESRVPDVTHLIDEAERHIRRGAFTQAAEAVSGGLAQATTDDQRVRLYNLRGVIGVRQGDYPTALEAYQAALGLSDRADLLISEAAVYTAMGDYRQAIAGCERALLRLDAPADRARALSGMAYCRSQQNDHTTALTLMERAVDLHYTGAALINLAYVQVRAGLLDAAEANLSRAADLIEGEYEAAHLAYARGELWAARGDGLRAQRSYEAARRGYAVHHPARVARIEAALAGL